MQPLMFVDLKEQNQKNQEYYLPFSFLKNHIKIFFPLFFPPLPFITLIPYSTSTYSPPPIKILIRKEFLSCESHLEKYTQKQS